MSNRTLAQLTLAEVRDMIANGLTDEDIQFLNDARLEAEIEAAQADDDYERRYGYDYDDDKREYGAQAEYNDRLSMGRNDAGEWLGFM